MVHPLDTLRVAQPCPADWHAMTGDGRVRFCDDCGLNVYNLSALSTADALELVQETEGRRCVRFYRRADGTVLTQDCPGAESDLAFARERLHGAAFALALLGAWIAYGPLADAAWSLAGEMLTVVAPYEPLMGEVEGPAVYSVTAEGMVTPDAYPPPEAH